jgi:hypothetical protein
MLRAHLAMPYGERRLFLAAHRDHFEPAAVVVRMMSPSTTRAPRDWRAAHRLARASCQLTLEMGCEVLGLREVLGHRLSN